MDAFPTLQLLDGQRRQQDNNIQFSSAFRERNLDHRQVTNIPAAKFPDLHDTDGELPLATPMPFVTTNKRLVIYVKVD